MTSTQYFVNDKTRLCRIVRGPGMAESAVAEGFREVTEDAQEAFRAVTQVALDAGWKPERIGYVKFLAKHPELVQPV